MVSNKKLQQIFCFAKIIILIDKIIIENAYANVVQYIYNG